MTFEVASWKVNLNVSLSECMIPQCKEELPFIMEMFWWPGSFFKNCKFTYDYNLWLLVWLEVFDHYELTQTAGIYLFSFISKHSWHLFAYFSAPVHTNYTSGRQLISRINYEQATYNFSLHSLLPWFKLRNLLFLKRKAKMTIEVYAHISSAPSRLVLMTCECLGLDYKFVSVDILEGEHKLPEYTKVRLELHIVQPIIITWLFKNISIIFGRSKRKAFPNL